MSKLSADGRAIEIKAQIATTRPVVPDVSGEPIGPEEMGDGSVGDTITRPQDRRASQRQTRNASVKYVESDRRHDHASDRYPLDLIEAHLIPDGHSCVCMSRHGSPLPQPFRGAAVLEIGRATSRPEALVHELRRGAGRNRERMSN